MITKADKKVVLQQHQASVSMIKMAYQKLLSDFGSQKGSLSTSDLWKIKGDLRAVLKIANQ